MIALALAVIVSTGAIDPSVTKEDVCTSGYTATVRPPVRLTNGLKIIQMKQRGITGDPSQYELDHYQALEIGGDPGFKKVNGEWIATHTENLWPELWNEARKKDVDETRLHRAVCKGLMTLQEAQAEIRKHWKIH